MVHLCECTNISDSLQLHPEQLLRLIQTPLIQIPYLETMKKSVLVIISLAKDIILGSLNVKRKLNRNSEKEYKKNLSRCIGNNLKFTM